MLRVLIVAFLASTAAAQTIDGTFSFQGRLTTGGSPVTGLADLEFRLFDAAVGGGQVGSTITLLNQQVTDGLFDADLDFGVGSLNGEQRWVEVAVRSPAGVGAYDNLGRQPLLGAPYAVQTRGIEVQDDLDVQVGRFGTNDFLRLYNETDLIADFGPSFSDQGSLLFMQSTNGRTIELDADRDDANDGISHGSLRVRSFSGGPGGEVSVRNDSGIETVSLLGGTTNSGGTLSMFDPLGVNTVRFESETTTGGGALRTFSEDGFAQFLLEPDIEGQGGYLQVNRSNLSSGFIVDGNFSGTNNADVFIRGVSRSARFSMINPGDLSVSLPTSAISDTEILDEPGVATIAANGFVSLSGGFDNIATRTINCPTSGYCVVIGTLQVNLQHSAGNFTGANFGVSDTSGVFPGNQDVAVQVPNTAPSGAYASAATVHGTFAVNSGNNTFYLIGNEYSGSAEVLDWQLSIIFIPTAYGTVQPTVLGGGGDDASAPRMLPMTAADIAAEQAQSLADDRARRDAEAAAYAERFAALEARIRELEAQQGGGAPIRRATPSSDVDQTGAALGHNSTSGR